MSDNDHLFGDPAEYARLALADLDANQYAHTDLTEPMLTAQRAGIAASLAIADHLGEIVEQLRISNALLGLTVTEGE